ncbi:MAG: PLDc N-terminal domain-containing protein, partial [Stackebrandtia sp.]
VLPRAIWVLIIVLIPILGGIFWFTHGRPRRKGGGDSAWRRKPTAPVAPDDDPEFLADLRRRLRDEER